MPVTECTEIFGGEAQRDKSFGLDSGRENPFGRIDADPAVIAEIGPHLGNENLIEPAAFSGVVILIPGIEETPAESGIEGDGTVAVSGLGGIGKFAPRKLPVAHVAGNGVRRTARIDGVGTVEPPARESGPVAFRDKLDDPADIFRKTVQISMNAVRVTAGFFPCRVVIAVAGMIVVGDKPDPAFVKGFDQFADKVASGGPAGQQFFQQRMRQRKIFFRMGEGEDAMPCADSGE